MKYVICAIFDKKTECFSQPMYFQTPAQGARSFGDAVNDPKSDFSRHPEDYALMHVGTFDESDGRLEAPAAGPVLIVQALSMVRESPQLSLVGGR